MISVAFGALVFGSHYSPVSRVFLLETVGLLGFHPSSPSGKGHSKPARLKVSWRSLSPRRPCVYRTAVDGQREQSKPIPSPTGNHIEF